MANENKEGDEHKLLRTIMEKKTAKDVYVYFQHLLTKIEQISIPWSRDSSVGLLAGIQSAWEWVPEMHGFESWLPRLTEKKIVSWWRH